MTQFVRLIIQESLEECEVTGTMKGRAKVNLAVVGSVEAKMECSFEVISESEGESPEKEMLRRIPSPENSASLISPPSARGFPPPAPLAFTPLKTLSETREGFETTDQVVVCEVAKEDSDWETIIDDCEFGSENDENDSENGFPAIDVDCEDWAEKFTISIRRFHNSGNYLNHIDVKCLNCDGVFTPHHQC